MSSECVCHTEAEFCFYCEMYVPLEEQLKIAKLALKEILEMDGRNQVSSVHDIARRALEGK